MRSLLIRQRIIQALVLLLLSTLCCFGQTRAYDSKSMINVFNNPAYVADDSVIVKLQLFSLESWVGGSKSALSLKDFTAINNNFFREKVLGTKTTATGWGGVNVYGPSLLVTPNKTFSFALTTKARVFANYWDVDGRLVSEVEESDKIQQQYPYTLANSNNMRLNTMAWSDVGLSFSMALLKKNNHSLRSGISLHYLSGISHSSIDANINGGTIMDFGGGLPYLTNSYGTVSTFTSGDFFNNPSIGKLFKKGGGSLGVDFGITYEFIPKGVLDQHKVKIGMSVTDIGKLQFIPDQQYSKQYNMNIPSPGGYLFFTQNFPNTPFNHLTIPLDSNGFYFKQTKINKDPYSINLPTSLHINADVQIEKDFYVNLALNTGLQPKNSTNSLYSYRSILFSPRYEKEKYSLQLPLSYQSYTGFNAGLAGRYGIFSIGTGSFFSALFSKSKQLDGYISIDIPLRKNKIVIIKNDKPVPITSINYNNLILPNTAPNKIPDAVPDTIPILVKKPLINDIHAFAELQSVNTTSGIVPFWIRSNQYGSVPVSGISSSFVGRIEKNYDSAIKRNKLDWSSALEFRLNGGSQANAILVEGYAKARYKIYELEIGRIKDIVGNVDPDLSSGAFAVSGNALPIPKIQLSIPEYVPVIGKGFFSIKGSFAHGWFGNTQLGEDQRLRNYYYDTVAKTYYHQFTLYGRLGRINDRFKAYAGINHEVMWGNEGKFEPNYELSKLETFFYVVVGRPYVGSKVGNHIGSIDVGFDYEWPKLKLTGYHQFFYDEGALFHLANLRDGLTGISLFNKDVDHNKGFFWRKILAEFMYSVNQAGQLDSRLTYSGDEDYYHNATYRYGWSYRGSGLGTPFATPAKYARADLPSRSYEFFINNRVSLFHIGFIGGINNWDISTKLSYSHNYGTYGTSPIGNSIYNIRYIGPPPYFTEVAQFSGYLEACKQLKNGYRIGGVLALDAGNLLYNSTGIILKASKQLNFK